MSRTGENARDRKSMREDLSSSLPESSLPTKRSFDDIEPERGFCEIDDSAPAISWKKNATDWDGEVIHEAKRQGSSSRLSCPFRKRNPLRFNVRDHLNCATQSFQSITLVKRHIANFHKQEQDVARTSYEYICSRCQKRFATLQDRDAHLRVPPEQICQLQDTVKDNGAAQDPEDGISPQVLEKLRDRRAKVSVTDWDTLWITLFPNDKHPKTEAFEPVIEVCEFQNAFENNKEMFVSELRVDHGGSLHTKRMAHQRLIDKFIGLCRSLVHHSLIPSGDLLVGSPAPLPETHTVSSMRAPKKRKTAGDTIRATELKALGSRSVFSQTASKSVVPRNMDPRNMEIPDRLQLPKLTQNKSLSTQEISPFSQRRQGNHSPNGFASAMMIASQSLPGDGNSPRLDGDCTYISEICSRCQLQQPCICSNDWLSSGELHLPGHRPRFTSPAADTEMNLG